MFDILLQQNKSDSRYINKIITLITSLTGELKNQSSLLTPIFVIQPSSSEIVSCNYFTIPVWNRSYFVTDIISITNDLVEIHGKVDVLTSFSNEILELECIIERQESLYNLYLPDGDFRIEGRPSVTSLRFPGGPTRNTLTLIATGGS